MNALIAARDGVGTITHFYGHLESMLRKGRPATYPRAPPFRAIHIPSGLFGSASRIGSASATRPAFRGHEEAGEHVAEAHR